MVCYGHEIEYSRDGAGWTFDFEPESVAQKNHRSANDHCKALAQELDRLESNRCIEDLPDGQDMNRFVSNINPFGAVVQTSNGLAPTGSRSGHTCGRPMQYPCAAISLHHYPVGEPCNKCEMMLIKYSVKNCLLNPIESTSGEFGIIKAHKKPH